MAAARVAGRASPDRMLKRVSPTGGRPPAPASAVSAVYLWRRFWVLFLLVGVITFCVFVPSLRNGFVDWDDDKNLLNNLSYRGLGPAQLRWMWTTFHLGPYQPLSWMTYGLDYLIWGMRPFGYHLTSVLLHAFAAALFAGVAARLFLLGRMDGGTSVEGQQESGAGAIHGASSMRAAGASSARAPGAWSARAADG